MRIRLLSSLLLVGLFPLTSAAQDKKANPYRDAKVGDYVTYKLTTSLMGKEFSIDRKETVTAKSDTELTVKGTTVRGGKEIPAQTTKIDLTMPFDPTGAILQGNMKGKFEKKDEGKEKIKIGDKTYACTWTSGKLVAEFKGNKVESDVKFWFSKSVPLAGLVKMEMKSDFVNVRLEVTGSGNDNK